MRLQHFILALVAVAAQTAMATPTTNPAELASLRPGFVPGYLPQGTAVDSVALLAPPPRMGSAAQAADDAAFRASRELMDSPRWVLAEKDAVLSFPKAAETFQCALGIGISVETTPHLAMLLRRTMADAGLATYKAKEFYQRRRPFMAHNDVICTPKEEAGLRKSSSYPSGHAAAGWAWGLVLTELAPERSSALLQRARAYGESRLVCGVHWASDVAAGQLVASAVFAQLHANPDFVEQLALARKEVSAARAAHSAPTADCALEASALARQP